MLQSLQVAIAHTNATTCDALHAALLRCGHTVCARAHNGFDFAAQIRIQHPDLIIVEASLPQLEELGNAAQSARIPTIVVLDANDGFVPEQFDSVDVLAVLQEPIRDSDLVPLIPLVMDRSNERQALQETIELLKAEIDQPPPDEDHPWYRPNSAKTGA